MLSPYPPKLEQPEKDKPEWVHEVTFEIDNKDYLEKLKQINSFEFEKALLGHPFEIDNIIYQLRHEGLTLVPDFTNPKNIEFLIKPLEKA